MLSSPTAQPRGHHPVAVAAFGGVGQRGAGRAGSRGTPGESEPPLACRLGPSRTVTASDPAFFEHFSACRGNDAGHNAGRRGRPGRSNHDASEAASAHL